MSEPQPPSGAPRLRYQSGAFDLPSILVGVVVVGILTAGVLAAIFGVIPWAQDRAAKQDLAAINTAQGVTYAKDGQTYKDLAGLLRMPAWSRDWIRRRPRSPCLMRVRASEPR